MAITTKSAEKGFIKYAAESTFGDSSQTSFGTRLPVLGRVDLSGFMWDKIPREVTTQYRNEMGMPILGPKSGSFTIEVWVAGHGTAATGAISDTAFAALFALIVGAKTTPPSGTTVSSATDADTWVVGSAGTWAAGHVGWLGVRGDGRGDGRPFPVLSMSGTTMNAAVALPAAPQNGDVVYTADNVYPDEDPDASFTSSRWELATANGVYRAYGCYPTAYEITTENGRPMRLRATMATAYWKPVEGVTVPTSDALAENLTPGNFTVGSLFLQAHGTTTRDANSMRANVRSVSLACRTYLAALPAPGASEEYQLINAVVRTAPGVSDPPELVMTVVEDAEAQDATPYIAGLYESQTAMHALLECNNAAAGKRVALRINKAYFTAPWPSQFRDDQGLNMQRWSIAACADPDGTTDPAQASFVWAFS